MIVFSRLQSIGDYLYFCGPPWMWSDLRLVQVNWSFRVANKFLELLLQFVVFASLS